MTPLKDMVRNYYLESKPGHSGNVLIVSSDKS